MSVLRSTVSLLGVTMWTPRKDPWSNYQQSIELMAKLPTIITTFARLRTGKMPLKPREDLGFAANFLLHAEWC